MMQPEVKPDSPARFSYRAAALIIKDGCLLAAKHRDHPLYYVVGGGVEPGETSRDAVVREMREEMGVLMRIERLAFVQERIYVDVRGELRQEIVFFYTALNNCDFQIPEGSHTDQGDAETLHWLPIDRLSEYNLVPEFLKQKNLARLNALEHIVSA